ncbi:MAG: 6-phosphogluconolactonase [Thermomicrobiales bacterium]
MRLIVADDYDGMSKLAADIVIAAVQERPASSILVATGNTPMGLYDLLATRQASGECDFSGVRAVQLDEYLGIGPEDPRSLFGWMRRSFVVPLAIPDAQVMRLRSDAADPDAACQEFAEAIRETGGIDIAILGLGPNGHLGFNEPPSAADAHTRVITLTPESAASSASYWGAGEDVPQQAMTVGMDILLEARLTIVVISGEHKRHILQQTLEGPVSSDLPASWLRTAENVVFIADRAAAGELALAEDATTQAG